MAKQSIAAANTVLVRKTPFQKFCTNFARNWQLHLLISLPVIYMLLFHYAPLFGLQIAFRDYSAVDRAGIFGADWIGLGNFAKFFDDDQWFQYVWNTLRISLYSIAAGFPVPIILALVIHVNDHGPLKKLAQNVSYIPHFISVVVLVGILNRIFDPFNGLIAVFYGLFDNPMVPDIMNSSNSFDHVYVWSGVWQGMGWSAIIYISSLSSVSPELHEAARIDGASRWKRVIHVDIPAIMPMICIQLILRMGSVLGVGYEKVYLMQKSQNMAKSQVISTYVYRKGFGGNGELGFGSAVGLMNSVIGTSMVLLVNWITNKLSDGEAGLF